MNLTRVEDRATRKRDPSAIAGAKTEGGRHDAALVFPFGIGIQAVNLWSEKQTLKRSLSPNPSFSISR